MSRNASECSSSKTITAPASFESISQKMQPSFMGPFLLLDLFSLVRQPGKIEKEAGQAVHVWNRLRINRLYLGQCCNASLSSPTDRSGDVKLGPGNASCRKDESSQRLQPAVNRINRLLQIINMGFANSRHVGADKL